MGHKDDNDELNELLGSKKNLVQYLNRKSAHGNVPSSYGDAICEGPSSEVKQLKSLTQWTTPDDKVFVPASQTASSLVPGLYEIAHSPTIGIYFQKTPVKTEGLLRFPQTNSEKVVREIQKFWDLEGRFREYGLSYKRGIIMWGPAGSGKSCTIQLIMQDVISRNGIVLKFTNPTLFMEGMRILREIQADTPIVVLMEDIDATIQRDGESEVLQILDGVDLLDKVCFLSTTNYPERLGARILNRPSRFDKRFKIGHPNPESRELYFKHLITEAKIKELKIDLKKWVADTEGFSLAHLKELFIAVIILGDDYVEATKTLGSMKEAIHSEDEHGRFMGFNGKLKDNSYDYE
jgi:hypothetical protein